MQSHTAWVIFGSTALAGLIRGTWAIYKARKAKEPTPMRLVGGVYVPWGIEERSRYWWARFGEVALIWFGLLALALAAKWTGFWPGF